jgi:hypothetical protein
MIKVCENCMLQYNARRSAVRFCSSACSNKWKGRNMPPSSTCFKRGNAAWNAGAKVSGMSGKRHSPETKAKMRASSTGQLGSNWKGGLTAENYRIRRSRQYADWRRTVFERDDYTCQECGARSAAGIRVRLEADHVQPFASFPDLRFDLSNGRTLCASCHRKTPTWGVTPNVAKAA